MAVPVRLLLGAVVVTAASVVAGVLVTTGSDDSSPAGPAVSDVSLADLDTTAMALERGPWCARVADTEVEAALGAPAESATSYDDGERVRLTGRTRDVAHEYGCTWTAADDTTARAWVFAPPVTRDRARELRRSATGTRGCTPLGAAEQYGAPSVALACRAKAGLEASYRGLFGDAWLTCTLTAPETVPRDELAARTDRWCAAVALAARG